MKFFRKIPLYIAELRLPFITASILPVALGTAVAWHETAVIDWFYFFLSAVGGAWIHAGANVSNDYFDHKSGCDEKNTEFVRPFTGGSRMIQKKLLTPREVLVEAIACFATGSAIGVYLSMVRGYPILVLGLIGVLSGYFYTGPPLRLASRGIGELVVGLNFGTLMTLGAYYVQAKQFSAGAFVASLPLAILIAAVLYINEFQDTVADEAAGKRHLVVRLGKARAAKVFAVVIILPYFAAVASVVGGIMPVPSLLIMAALPLSIIAARTALKKHADSRALVPANALTVLSHLAAGILLVAGYVIS